MEKIILVDGNSIANRAFYALPMLSNSQGMHTNAVYGFTMMLLRIIEEEKPTHFMVAFDAGKITFRHQDFKEYKGGRMKTPPELSEQFPMMKELLQAFRIFQYELEGYEADDIIGTISRLAEEREMEVLIVTGDKDMLQLASDRTTILLTRKGITEVDRFDPAAVEEKYGLQPKQIIDLKGLMGDPSDNIPGVPGVGEKTALKLLHEYASVENVLKHADGIKGKLGENIRSHSDSAQMSKELATIFREVEVPIEGQWDRLEYGGFDARSVKEMFRKLEFKSLLEKMDLSEESRQETEQEQIAAQIVTSGGLPDFIGMLPSVEAMHIEVAGENPHASEIIGYAFLAEGKAYYMSQATMELPEAGKVREWLADETIEKRMYDMHKAAVALAWKQQALRGVVFDVMLAAYLLDPTESSLSLHGLADKFRLPPISEDERIFGKGAKFRVPKEDQLSAHLCRKAAAIRRLSGVLQQELENSGMHRLFYDLELPLSAVLAEMELTGVLVDTEDLKSYGKELEGILEGLMADIHDLAGMEFNINSPKQLGEILFDKLGLPVIKKTKTGYSTDAEVLEKLAPYHEIVDKILHYRQIAKLLSTYVEGLLKEIRPETHKVHTYFRQTVAATGRLSSQFPNLQNIPIRMEEGRKIRKVFVPSEPGWYILAADYSQIELRVLAHISQDDKLIEAFQHNKDIHTKTAMDVFGVSEDQVDANLRRQAKAVNFGIVYGISDYGLSQNLNITRKEAGRFIEQYLNVFMGVRKFMEDIVQRARRDGYVTTLLQRRRYLPEINSSNYNLRSFAERTAMNSPIQGSAADIIKLAMVQLHSRLQREKLKSRMLLQVHDELVLEVPEDELERMKKLVPEVMEGALKLDVPLKADVSYGLNWYEAK
ncbi:DNA polymerase I [Ferviditalea candida]|uniref:DNA polymerase I n=1 Tax=Ferviditalea candida TaxID=3108399 RepID=A0ABU5ZDC5_9BACL|nr:DNA polymerase I [Paenibacillaceae bacterium T2]